MISDVTFYCVQYHAPDGPWRWVNLSEDFVVSEDPLQYPFRGFKEKQDAEDLVRMLKRSNLEQNSYRIVEVNGYSQVKEPEDVLPISGREVPVLCSVET